MADVVIFHNPNCSTSRFAVELAAELGISVEERRYLLKAERPTRSQLLELLGQLEDPATDLVRRDATFARLELSDDDVSTVEQVADVLSAHSELLQRPVLVRDGKAIIGRPRDRVAPFLSP